MMRKIANIAILSILAAPIALLAYITLMLCHPGAKESDAWATAMGFAVAMYFLGIGSSITFLLGLITHAIIAVKTRTPCLWVWWFSIIACAIGMMVVRPLGTVTGGVIICLMITTKPFRIMKNGVEPTAAASPPLVR